MRLHFLSCCLSIINNEDIKHQGMFDLVVVVVVCCEMTDETNFSTNGSLAALPYETQTDGS